MKKFLILFSVLILGTGTVLATEQAEIIKEQTTQEQINSVGMKVLNANQIDKRIIFVYDKAEKKSILKSADELTKRQIIITEGEYKFVANDDELAALVSRGISMALKSYGGIWRGGLNAIQVKAAPKLYEIVADKRAVDFMVTADYDPIAMITFINKSQPQKRYDTFSGSNLTSKRLAIIYEYIYTKYPYYLANNKYLEDESYQNFLLTSVNNRKKLEDKIKKHSEEKIKYD